MDEKNSNRLDSEHQNDVQKLKSALDSWERLISDETSKEMEEEEKEREIMELLLLLTKKMGWKEQDIDTFVKRVVGKVSTADLAVELNQSRAWVEIYCARLWRKFYKAIVKWYPQLNEEKNEELNEEKNEEKGQKKH